MTLKLPLALHEATIEKFRARDRLTREIIPDADLEAMHSAMASARADADRIAAMHEAVFSDKTITAEAAALKVRKLALQLGERASEKLDHARQRATKAIESIKKATRCPAPPKDALTAQLEGEIRARMMAMPPKDRGEMFAKAITDGDELIVGAVLRAPAMLSGMTGNEHEMRRSVWRQKSFPKEFDREQRLAKAVDALDRGGASLVSFIEAAANPPGAIEAEAGVKRSAAAVAAATAE